MTKLTVLPHETLAREGRVIEATAGRSICDNLLDNGVEIEHACEKSCACTTCHVVVREGFDALDPSEENEDDMLDKAWGLEPQSRLSCQAIVKDGDLTIEIPRYTINMVKEGGKRNGPTPWRSRSRSSRSTPTRTRAPSASPICSSGCRNSTASTTHPSAAVRRSLRRSRLPG